MDTYTALMICEGAIDADSDEHGFEAWQYLIDTGLVWQLQGFFGRTARDLIEAGICTPATGN
jgi:hypothetical protein